MSDERKSFSVSSSLEDDETDPRRSVERGETIEIELEVEVEEEDKGTEAEAEAEEETRVGFDGRGSTETG